LGIIWKGFLGIAAIPPVAWVGVTLVRSFMEGTPLNGLRKLLGKPTAPSKKTALSIIVLTAPEPKWHVGAMG
jgi:hypothetical protein